MVQAALPRRRGNHVPKADVALAERDQALFIIKRLQVDAKYSAEQAPELVSRVCIVTACGK